MTSTVVARYDALVTSRAIERDPAQVALVERLDALAAALARRAKARGNPLSWLFGRDEGAAPRGLYIWGSVGRGKTMLMDLFMEALPTARKRRVHFHAFMAQTHGRIFAFRQEVKAGRAKDTDPIAAVAEAIARETDILCFDEFAVADIADAMILGRLFAALFSSGVTVVATSNVVPDRLYEGGLNRALFLPFIAMLEDKLDIVELSARTDFRLEKLGGSPVYLVPADDEARRALDLAFLQLSGTARGAPAALPVQGHAFELPQAAAGVARASFSDLCSRPYGGADYLALAQAFHSLVLDGIPRLDATRRNEAKRFIILIDTLYDHHVKLIASAAAPPNEIYRAEQGREAFEFDRTVSRLIEMQSRDYLALPHGRPDSAASGDTTGLVET